VAPRLLRRPPRVAGDDVEESKPAPDTVEVALASLLVPVERAHAVLIGDTPYDVIAGRDARIDVIGVRTGGWSNAELAGAVAVFADVTEIEL